MSSTLRGYNRHKSDYYVTPKKDVYAFLGAWLGNMQAHYENTEQAHLATRPGNVLWLDPCAGGDSKHGMTYADAICDMFNVDVHTIDIRADSPARQKADYLATALEFHPMVIVSNPPFVFAQEFIEKALLDVADGGFVVMLLRLNFLGSKGREVFFKKHMPQAIYVHPRRMSFTEDKKTDSIEYAHFVWQKGYPSNHSHLYFV